MTGTLADTIDWYSAIQTLDIVDFALVDVVLAVGLGGAFGTIDAFVRANQVLANAAIVTWIRVTLILFRIAILSRPTGFAFALEVTGTIGTLTMETWFAEALVDIVLTIFAIVTLTT